MDLSHKNTATRTAVEAFIGTDAGYRGAEKRPELQEVTAQWHIAERPGKLRTLKLNPDQHQPQIQVEYLKASIRAKVEHVFRVLQCQFGFTKTRYRGMKKNDSQLAVRFTLANFARIDPMLRAG